METEPVPATLRMVLVAVAVLLAVVGIGGVATGAADDDGGDKAATSTDRTTTTFGDVSETTPSDGATTSTVVPGATPTTSRATATTAAGPATTVKTDSTNACDNPPETSTNPGPLQAPAVGVYSYVSCANASDQQTERVEAGTDSDGHVRRRITQQSNGIQLTQTNSYSAEGTLQEVLDISAFGRSEHCDWNPDVQQFPSNPSVGREWSVNSSCRTNIGQLTAKGSGKITGRRTVTIGGTAVSAWVLEGSFTLTIPGQGSVKQTETDYFDPSRGIDLYRKTTQSDAQGESVTVIRRVASLTPQPL